VIMGPTATLKKNTLGNFEPVIKQSVGPGMRLWGYVISFKSLNFWKLISHLLNSLHPLLKVLYLCMTLSNVIWKIIVGNLVSYGQIAMQYYMLENTLLW